MPLDESHFKEIVGAILKVSRPAAIVLFGSQARGDVHEFSDVDLLVIRAQEFQKGESRRKELGVLYRSISSICNVPKDIILFTTREFSSWSETTNHMAASAKREGRILYGEI
jgi:predicted nucleotidyltransferase